MNFLHTTKVKQFIEEKLDARDIFAYYLGISVNDISYCLDDRSNKINNPLRDDKNPSLGFMYSQSGKLRMKDFANDLYSGDIYDLVGFLYGLNSNNSKDFIQICSLIIEHVYYKHFNYNIPTIINKIPINKTIKTIDIIKRDFTKEDLNYWKYIPIEILKYFIIPVEKLYINDYLNYNYKRSNPCYAYPLGIKNNINIYKIYCPFEVKERKFRTNNIGVFDSLERDFTESDTLIITKSYKDKLYWKYLLLLASSFPIGCIPAVVSFSSEGILLSKDIAFELSKLYDRIIINCDFDKVGIQSMFYHTMCYNYEVFTFGRSIEKIDFNEFEKKHFIEKVSKDSNRNITNSMLDNFISSLSDTYIDKDLYEYIMKHSIKDTLTKLLTIYE